MGFGMSGVEPSGSTTKGLITFRNSFDNQSEELL
jgi:hypothetical protein